MKKTRATRRISERMMMKYKKAIQNLHGRILTTNGNIRISDWIKETKIQQELSVILQEEKIIKRVGLKYKWIKNERLTEKDVYQFLLKIRSRKELMDKRYITPKNTENTPLFPETPSLVDIVKNNINSPVVTEEKILNDFTSGKDGLFSQVLNIIKREIKPVFIVESTETVTGEDGLIEMNVRIKIKF